MTEALRRTPLYDTHVELGGRMVPFSGWEMPIQYDSILLETRLVRFGVGLFDVSHMGRVEVNGPGAGPLLSSVLSVSAMGLREGSARYNVICDEQGGIIDDGIVYRKGEEQFLVIPNAGNRAAVYDWIVKWNIGPEPAEIVDVSDDYAMIACQGPAAEFVLEPLSSVDLSKLRPFRYVDAQLDGVDTMFARTGYTGEDGFELILPSESAGRIWSLLMDKGAIAAGLGARDVLRMEAGLLLHGSDMSTEVNPYEAALERFVRPNRRRYIAGEALRRIRDEGVSRRMVGFNMVERGIPRHGYAIMGESGQIGEVTSGGYSPTLDRNIGMGYVQTDYSAEGSRFHIDIRGRSVEAEVTSLPFYTRRRRSDS